MIKRKRSTAAGSRSHDRNTIPLSVIEKLRSCSEIAFKICAGCFFVCKEETTAVLRYSEDF